MSCSPGLQKGAFREDALVTVGTGHAQKARPTETKVEVGLNNLRPGRVLPGRDSLWPEAVAQLTPMRLSRQNEINSASPGWSEATIVA